MTDTASEHEETNDESTVNNNFKDDTCQTTEKKDLEESKDEEKAEEEGLNFRGLGPVYQSVFLDCMGIRSRRPIDTCCVLNMPMLAVSSFLYCHIMPSNLEPVHSSLG